jgi:hypothetical protein
MNYARECSRVAIHFIILKIIRVFVYCDGERRAARVSKQQ